MSRIASPVAAANESAALNTAPTRRVFIKSFGCQMNVYDSQRMADVAGHEGFTETPAIEDADLVVLNTCHIRERASEKIYSELGKIRELKQARAAAGRKTTLVVAGCVAQAEGREILRRQPAVDLVVGPQNYHRLPELLAGFGSGRGRGRHRIPRRGQVRSPARRLARSDALSRRQRLCHRAGGLRQVLFVLRRALYARDGELAPGRQDPCRNRATGARRCARIHAARPERQRLSRPGRAGRGRGPGRSPRARGAHSRRVAAALCDLPSQRHARGPDTRPCRDRRPGAISASADPIGLGPDTGGDEPSAYEASISAKRWPGSGARARTSRSPPTSSSAFPARAKPTSRPRSISCAKSYSPPLSPSNIRLAPERPRPTPPSRSRPRSRSSVSRVCRLFSRSQRQAFNHASVGRRFGVVFDKPGRHEGQFIGRSPYMQSVNAVVDPSRLGELVDVEATGVKPNSLTARVVASTS